jgi:hypothetical protein
MANQGPMHWRGDRTGGSQESSAQPNEGAFDEQAAFKQFNPAFVGLLGRHAQLSEAEMQQFTDFILQIVYPPNPIRNLDNSLTPAQQAGRDFYFNVEVALPGSCESCHRLDPLANPEEGSFAGFFGTDGRSSFALEPQIVKIPHLRNMYQKVGMFGAGFSIGVLGPDPFMGDQIRGFGFNHDGSIPDMFRFNSLFDASVRNPRGIPTTPEGAEAKRNMEQFMLAFDSNLAPIVGQQVTLTARNEAVALPRIQLLMARADVGECDLVAKGSVNSRQAGFLYLRNGQFKSDRQAIPQIPEGTLRTLVAATDGVLTYTCTPPGSGVRIGIDRDLNGVLDGDERSAGSNPADPHSTP